MITVKRENVERLVASKEDAARWLAMGYEIVNFDEPIPKTQAPNSKPPQTPKDKKDGGKNGKTEKAENPNAEKSLKDGEPDGADPTGAAQAVLQSGT